MILVGEDYKIGADKYQFILHTRKATTNEKAKSEFTWSQTYHASIAQCLKAIEVGMALRIAASDENIQIDEALELIAEKISNLNVEWEQAK